MVYADECFLLGVTYRREFTNDIGLEPDKAIYFRVEFKNLGALGDNDGVF